MHLHQPGPGVGGHCIPVDPYFIIEVSPFLTPLMQQARQTNQSMPEFVAEYTDKITQGLTKQVTVFGLTYKGNVSDMRESPALEVIRLLSRRGYRINVHDPYIRSVPKLDLNCHYFNNPFEALHHSNCLIVLADHREFQHINEQMLITQMKTPLIFDTKRIVRPLTHPTIRHFHFGNLHMINGTSPIIHEESAATQHFE